MSLKDVSRKRKRRLTSGRMNSPSVVGVRLASLPPHVREALLSSPNKAAILREALERFFSPDAKLFGEALRLLKEISQRLEALEAKVEGASQSGNAPFRPDAERDPQMEALRAWAVFLSE